jgi:hypothetical protein
MRYLRPFLFLFLGLVLGLLLDQAHDNAIYYHWCTGYHPHDWYWWLGQ